MKSIKEYQGSNKRVLVRVDFNVPLDKNYQVTDETRLRGTLPTIQHLIQKNNSVILMSHLGRPKDGYEEKYSLKHLIQPLSKLLNKQVHFAEDCISESTLEKAIQLLPGEVMLIENLRFYPDEEKGSSDFARKLARLGEIYVNDAFGTAHRAHASVCQIADFFTEKYAGFLMFAEIENANRILRHAQKPFVAVLGGAKVSDKILIIERLIEVVDSILIGGGMAYTFFKALGFEIGNSLCEQDKLEYAIELLKKAERKGVKILLPYDSVIADKFANDANITMSNSKSIPSGYMGLDIGEIAIEQFGEEIKKAKTILWNGPMGVFEMPNFAKGSFAIARLIAEATEKGAFSLIGGGDSAAAVTQSGYADKVSYISTGGGALLEYMEGKTLPGVAALQ
ncbi:MAG: phosphoglycerate kinase [Bacteroidia bacterium]|nr:phosphoglycerate kinase [Bacteroidia bacterium]MDW8345681.1 phosphoglycerate kinase [Bacteroidia bacterium]